MLEPKSDAPLSEIQLEVIKKTAEGFKTPDSTGKLHTEVAESIRRNIAIAKNPVVRATGVDLLGNYANGSDRDCDYVPRVQEKVLEEIATIGADDPSAKVKEAALYQISEIFYKPDFNEKIGDQVVEAIRKVVASVTVTEQDSPEAEVVKKALDKLSSYANGIHKDWEYIPQVQSKARRAIDSITATMGVAKFEDLKPQDLIYR